MLQYSTAPVSVTGPHGRIWSTKPKTGVSGLVTVLQVPPSNVSEAVRGADYSAVALDARADRLLTADTRGTAYLFSIRQNRYARLDRTGHAGTAAAFDAQSSRLVFVAFSDASIRCYDTSKNACVAMLREHRSPVRHMEAHPDASELLSTSVDGVMVWDTKKLVRKRVLGSGPYGAVKASYSADGQAIISHFKDGSFYVFAAGNFSLLRSFTLPVAPVLRALQSTFALSPDGQLLVSGAAGIPLLFVYSALTGQLLYSVSLPSPAGDTGPGLPAPEELGASVAGTQQLVFLQDSATVAALCRDGSMRFVDVRACRQRHVIPYQEHNRRDCHVSLDEQANHAALASNGKVFLYDLELARRASDPAVELVRIANEQLQPLAQALNSERLQQAQALMDRQEQQANSGAAAEPGTAAGERDVSPAPDAAAAGARKAGSAAAASKPAARGRRSGGPAVKLGRSPGKGPQKAAALALLAGGTSADLQAVQLNRNRLTALLEAFGEYPARYRLLVWDFLLRLPHNKAAFAGLVNLGPHPAYTKLQERLPMAGSLGRALAQRLEATLSQLAHWCPVFGEVSFLPGLVFPFVKMYAAAAGPGASLDESCFELLATVLCSWCRGWFERFPHPPLGVLNRMQDLLQFHDAPLAAHFAACYRGGLPGVLWPHMATLLTELLPRQEWIKLWDHCLTAGPDYLYFIITAYLIHFRSQLLALDTDHTLANWLAAVPAVDMNKVLRTAYTLRARTPEEVRPVAPEWQPLPQGPTYTEFKEFPAGAVELFAQDRAKLLQAEEAIMRRRAVVSELELRSRAVALQAASLSSERQQLAALEEERKAAMRKLEVEAAEQLQRLDDRAKEERLKQVAVVEQAYQASLLEVRTAWQRELESVRSEVAHKKALLGQQLRSKEEDEQIKALEFHSRQRMWALEQDAVRSAAAAKARDEMVAKQAELEAKQRTKIREWEQEEDERKIKLQADAARRALLAAQAEEEAAKQAAARDALALQLQAEDQLLKVESERRLRLLAEDQHLVTADALSAERSRLAARAEADEQAMRLKAKADVAWYEAEQLRRQQMLQQEKQQLEATAAEARKRLADAEAAARAMTAEAALLERRRFLERQNANEEGEALRLLEAIAAERARDAQVAAELDVKEQEMKSQLDYAARVGSIQREVESREAVAAEALRARLDEQHAKEVAELRRRHEEVMERLARDKQAQMAEMGGQYRVKLQAEQLHALQAQQRVFERRKQALKAELAEQELQAAGLAAPSRPTGDPAQGRAQPRGVQLQPGHMRGPLSPRDGTPTRSGFFSESNMTPGASTEASFPVSLEPSLLPGHPALRAGRRAWEAAGQVRHSAPHLPSPPFSELDSSISLASSSERPAGRGAIGSSIDASAAAAAAVARAARVAAQAMSPRPARGPGLAPGSASDSEGSRISLLGLLDSSPGPSEATTTTTPERDSFPPAAAPGAARRGHMATQSASSLGFSLGDYGSETTSGGGAAVAPPSTGQHVEQPRGSRSLLQHSGLLGLSQPAAGPRGQRAAASFTASGSSATGNTATTATASSASFTPAPLRTALPATAGSVLGQSQYRGIEASPVGELSPSSSGSAPTSAAVPHQADAWQYHSSSSRQRSARVGHGMGPPQQAPGGHYPGQAPSPPAAAAEPTTGAVGPAAPAATLAGASGEVAALLRRLQLSLELSDEEVAALSLESSLATTTTTTVAEGAAPQPLWPALRVEEGNRSIPGDGGGDHGAGVPPMVWSSSPGPAPSAPSSVMPTPGGASTTFSAALRDLGISASQATSATFTGAGLGAGLGSDDDDNGGDDDDSLDDDDLMVLRTIAAGGTPMTATTATGGARSLAATPGQGGLPAARRAGDLSDDE